MKKLIIISIIMVLANATLPEWIADGRLAEGIWDCGGKYTLYHPECYGRINNYNSFLCPNSFTRGLVYGGNPGNRSTTQAMCFSDSLTHYELRYELPYPNNLHYIDIANENKIEWDLYYFLLGWVNICGNGSYNYDEFTAGFSDINEATPCSITKIVAVEGGENQYTTYYFEVDRPNFTFHREDFPFRGITYKKMYCDNKIVGRKNPIVHTNDEAYDEVHDEAHYEVHDELQDESYDENQNTWIIIVIFITSSIILLIILLCWFFCCGVQKKNDIVTKKIEDEAMTTFQV